MPDKMRIDEQLHALAAQGEGSSDLVAFEMGAGQTLELQRAAIERLACSFERLTLRSAALTTAGPEHLKQVAESLSHRLSYLLEPIRPLEIDDEACIIQMRSVPPSVDDEGSTYYELVVSRGQIDLCRYTKKPGHSRGLVPATLTREAFCRLAQDFLAAVG